MSGVYRKVRGESRAIYTAMADDPDFVALGRDAKLVLYTLKLLLGASGIDVMYAGELADRTSIPYPEIEPALQELEESGWIHRERNLLWLRNGLRFDPYLSTTNRRHVVAICDHLRGLPRLAIVEEFCAYYGIDPGWIENGVPDDLPDGGGSSRGDAETPQAPKNDDRVSDRVPDSLTGTHPDTGGSREEEGGRRKEITTTTTTSSKSDEPISELWEIWIEELGGKAPHPRLTRKRRTKLRALYREQLRTDDDPLGLFRAVLGAVKASDHHMSKRPYQMPESLFRNEERRDRWVHEVKNPTPTARSPDFGDETDRDRQRASEARARQSKADQEKQLAAEEEADRSLRELEEWYAGLDVETRQRVDQAAERKLEGLEIPRASEHIRRGIERAVWTEFRERENDEAGAAA